MLARLLLCAAAPPIAVFAQASCAQAQTRPACTQAQTRPAQSEDLRAAARSNDLATVKKLGDKGVDANDRGEFNDTALTWAAYHDNLAMVTYLLNHGAKPNGLMRGTALGLALGIRDAQGGTALSFALENKNAAIVRELLAHHVDVEELDDVNDRPLLVAARKGDAAVARLLLDAGAKPDARNDLKKTALMAAVSSTEVMQLLLDRGAQVNAVDQSGYTPLFYAADNPAAVRFLLAHGAAVNIVSRMGETPLLYALRNPQTVQALLDAGADVEYVQAHSYASGTALMQAAGIGRVDTVKALLKHGANVGHQTEEGQTALMSSSGRASNIETMQVLLTGGADVHQRDKQGETALMVAAASGSAAQMQLLLAHGADIRVEDNYGFTLLLTAARYANVDTAQFLLKRGADIQARIRKNNPLDIFQPGDTALMLLLNDGTQDIAMLDLLLNKGAAVNAANDEGVTPLMHAAQWNHVWTAKILLAHGAKLNARDKKGQTALKYALHSPRGVMRDVTRLLLKAGATVDAADKPLIKTL